MFHFQAAVDNWEEALHRLPDGALIKAVDQGSMLRTAKLINPNLTTMLRHFGGPQNIHDYRGFEAYKQLARDFFATFIDGTFRQQYAQHTDLIQEWNEYLASSHSGAELQDRLDWAEAVAWVWKNEYRTQSDYAHIRLALVNAPVGNNIDRKFAEIALQYDCVLSYHAYDKWLSLNNRDPLSWTYHCGRWAVMESGWGGLRPDWLFGEAGPYGTVVDGWRSNNVLGGNRDAYVQAMRTWINELKSTPAYQEGRIYGFSLFTTGETSGTWYLYYTEQPELNMLADMIREEWQPGSSPPPPPPPPPPSPDPGLHRYLWDLAHEHSPSNFEAALQQHILNYSAPVEPGLKPFGKERWGDYEGVPYAVQAAVDWSTKQTAVFYSIRPHWNDYQIIWDPDQATGLHLTNPLPHAMSINSAFNAARDYSAFGGKTNDFHEGLDLAAGLGDRVGAAAAGVVDAIRTSDTGGYGRYVRTRHEINGTTYLLWYTHLHTVTVSVGQSVGLNQQLGTAGSSGNSSGPHLHITIQKIPGGLSGYVVANVVDPAPYLGLPPTSLPGPA
jgi:murein DD-endopeptidase MepM/ murein hydrolase activator NlpD